MDKQIVTRFAPSPTGHMHIGNMRTALFNYLYAMHYQGKFILRIDDTDSTKCKDSFVTEIKESLKALRLGYDACYFQSTRGSIYDTYIHKLISLGYAYACICNQKECSCHQHQYPVENNAIRLKALTTRKWYDGCKKKYVDPSTKVLSNIVIKRAKGCCTYNFCSVVDDITLGVTHVIRGDDHIDNTGIQNTIYEALDVQAPEYIHIPLILHENGMKLSKRNGIMDNSIMEMVKQGITSGGIMSYLMKLGWSYQDRETFSLEEAVSCFGKGNFNKKSPKYDRHKLLWHSLQCIKKMSKEQYIHDLKYYLHVNGITQDFLLQHQDIETIVELFKNRFYSFDAFCHYFTFLQRQESYRNDAFTPALTSIYKNFFADVNTNIHSASHIRNCIKVHCLDIKALSYTLTRQNHYPAIEHIIQWLGIPECLKRIHSKTNGAE